MSICIEDAAYCMRIIREAEEALDQVHVPRAPEQPALVERIGLLAQQRDAMARELGRETEEARRLSSLVRQLNEERGTIQKLLTDAGSPTSEPSQGIVWLARELNKRTNDLSTETERADTLSGHLQEIVRALGSAGINTSVATIENGVDQLISERAQLRRMHDGVSIDLDRERREKQEALGEAATRELKLIEERDTAINQSELAEQYKRAIAQRDKVLADVLAESGVDLLRGLNWRVQIQHLTTKIEQLKSQDRGAKHPRQISKKTRTKGKKRGPHK